MFYRITYDGPACSSRCSDIAKYAHFTPFFQALEMTFDPRSLPMGFHMCIWYQCAVLHVADMNFWRYLDSDLVFDPCDSKWPRIKKWSNNFCRGAQGLSYTQVTWSCYAIWGVAILVKITFLTSVTLDDLWSCQGSYDICGLGHWSLWPSFIEIDQSSLKVHI